MTELINITKKYGTVTVLDGLSLTVADGERILLSGESGCGKSTLLRIISGLEAPDSGEIRRDEKITYMTQEPRLLPWKNARDNIIAVVGKQNSHLADKYLDAVGLSDSARLLPSQLSGGMAQRVSLARALAYAELTHAELIMLDEPFSALDHETRKRMADTVLSCIHGATLILVSHASDIPHSMFDRTLELTRKK